nr:unnamed protein product [Digitaria exilis]
MAAGPSRCRLCFLLLLLLLVFTRPSACRPLNGNIIVILQQLPHQDAAAPSSSSMSIIQQQQYQWVLNSKPRGKPPPSAPSKRTN